MNSWLLILDGLSCIKKCCPSFLNFSALCGHAMPAYGSPSDKEYYSNGIQQKHDHLSLTGSRHTVNSSISIQFVWRRNIRATLISYQHALSRTQLQQISYIQNVNLPCVAAYLTAQSNFQENEKGRITMLIMAKERPEKT